MRNPFTLADYHASRYICEPLHLLDYCLINDGGVALILTTAERARDLKQTPVYVRGYGMATTLAGSMFPPDDFWRGSMRKAGEKSFRMAGVTPADISTLMIYDNFTPTVLFSLEGYGYCGEGESGPFVAEGHLALGGALSDQHLGRASLRILHAGLGAQSRSGAAGARPMRRAPGEGLRARALHGGGAGRDLDHLRQGAVMRPLPQTDGPDRPFWQALRRREVQVQRCGNCGTHRFPATRYCAHCRSDESEWVAVAPGGTLETWCVFHRPYFDGSAGALHGDPGAARLRRARVRQSGGCRDRARCASACRSRPCSRM